MLKLLALLALALNASASVLDDAGPTDAGGRPQVDLYDATGAQRGTLSNQLSVNNSSPGGYLATVNPFNRLQVTPEPSDLLSDKFDAALDTTTRWNAQLVGAGANATAGGTLNLTAGSATGNAAIVSSQPVFTQKANVQVSFATVLKFEAAPIVAGDHRFWGLATAGANTTANPVTDGIGWEIDTSGALNACVYQGGVKIFSQALTIPTDGLNHRYSFIWRTDRIAFYLDGGDPPPAIANGKIPNVQVLPVRMHAINGVAATQPMLTVTSVGVADTGRNSAAISDGLYGFLKATVKPFNQNPTGADNALVVSVAPTAPVTYSTSITNLTVGNTPTDIFTINGAANKTIRVTRIALTGTQTTGAQRDVLLYKRSSASVGGTSTVIPAFAHDSLSPAATATVRSYTVNPTTLGNTVGILRTRKVYIATANNNSDEFIMEFGTRPSQSLVLRSAAEGLALNLNGVAMNGSNLNISIEWTEE